MRAVKRLGLVIGMVAFGLAPAAAAQGAAAPSAQDKQFLEAIHQVNLAEIAGGNLAKQKVDNQQVKDLGDRFVKDHSQLDSAVQSAASAANITLPNAPTEAQQQVLDQLQGVSGAEFDKMWISAQLAGHVQAMQLVQTELDQGSDPAVKQVAQDAEPVLKAHHDALLALAQQLGVPAPGGTPGTPSPGGTPGTPSPGGTPGTPSPTETTPSPEGTTPTPEETTGTQNPTEIVPSPQES